MATDTRSISTRVAIEGEKEYSNALKTISASLNELDANLKMSASAFAENANSEAALSEKAKLLESSLAEQAKRLETLKSGLENARAAQQKWADAMGTAKANLTDTTAKLSALDEKTRTAGEQWNAYKANLDAAQAELKKLQKSSDDTGEAEEKLKSKIENIESSMDELNKSTDGAAEATGNLIKEQATAQGEVDRFNQAWTKATNGVAGYEKKIAAANTQTRQTEAELQRTNQYLDEAKSSAEGCATSIDRFGKEVKEAGEDAKEGGENIKGSGDAIEGLSSMLMAVGVQRMLREISDAFRECSDTAATFEYTMDTVQAVAGTTDQELAALKAQAKDYAASSVFMANDLAKSYSIMGTAGWNAEQMLSGMSGIMQLASASGEGLSESVDLVMSSLSAFGYTAADSAHFSDVLAKSSASANTTVAQMGEAFKQVANTAGALGYTIEDVALNLDVMADMGLRGEGAGTALATALTRMSGANETASKAMKELGLSMFDSQGNAKELSVFMGELRDAFAGMTPELKENYAYQLAGQKGMKGLLAIVNTSADRWNDLSAAINSANGAAAEMSGIKLDNYAGQVALLQSATEGLELSIGDQLNPALGDLATAGTKAAAGLTGLVDKNKAVVPVATGAAVAIGVFTTGVTVSTVAVRAYDAAIKTLGGRPWGYRADPRHRSGGSRRACGSIYP